MTYSIEDLDMINTTASRKAASVPGLERLFKLLSRIMEKGFGHVRPQDMWDDVHPMKSETYFSIFQSLEESKLCMAALTEIRSHLTVRIRSLKNRIAPFVLSDGIERLPNEVLAQVFRMGHLDHTANNYKLALRVSHVSRRFRDVALNMPYLWTRIACWYKHSQREAFLYRSRHRGLDVRAGAYTTPEELQSFLCYMAPYSDRISELHLGIDSSKLRELSIPDLHNLQVLEYSGNRAIHSVNLNLPLSQLTCVVVHFDLTGNVCELLATALCRMSNLRELRVVVSMLGCALRAGHLLDTEKLSQYSIPIDSLHVTIKGITQYKSAWPVYGALIHFLPITLTLCVEWDGSHSPLHCLTPSHRNLFPYASEIRIQVTLPEGLNPRPWWDFSPMLTWVVEGCKIVKTVRLEVPEGYFTAEEITLNTWKMHSSIRNLRFKNCLGLSDKTLGVIARDLIGDEENLGSPSLEIHSCHGISDDFLLNLEDRFGNRFRWTK